MSTFFKPINGSVLYITGAHQKNCVLFDVWIRLLCETVASCSFQLVIEEFWMFIHGFDIFQVHFQFFSLLSFLTVHLKYGVMTLFKLLGKYQVSRISKLKSTLAFYIQTVLQNYTLTDSMCHWADQLTVEWIRWEGIYQCRFGKPNLPCIVFVGQLKVYYLPPDSPFSKWVSLVLLWRHRVFFVA